MSNSFRINSYLPMDENSLFGLNLQVPDYQVSWTYFYFVIGHFFFVCEMFVFFAYFSIKFYVLLAFFFLHWYQSFISYMSCICFWLIWGFILFSLAYFYIKLIFLNKKKPFQLHTLTISVIFVQCLKMW